MVLAVVVVMTFPLVVGVRRLRFRPVVPSLRHGLLDHWFGSRFLYFLFREILLRFCDEFLLFSANTAFFASATSQAPGEPLSLGAAEFAIDDHAVAVDTAVLTLGDGI